MASPYRFALAPRWWVGHVLVVAAAVTMIALGRWQLRVSQSKGFSLQNFGYAIQWWLFAAFAVGMWIKVLRDVVRHQPTTGSADGSGSPPPADVAAVAAGDAATAPVEYRRYRPPQRAVAEDDPVTAQYNAYLASLAERADAAQAQKGRR